MNKFSYMKNLYLENDAIKTSSELSLLKLFDCNLIVDSTTLKNGQNTKMLREISKICGIDICFGYTLKEDLFNSTINIDFSKVHNDIRYEITYGYEDLIPGFLGEFIISDQFPNEKEIIFFDIVFKVVYEYNIPVFIKLNYNSNSKVVEYFEENLNKNYDKLDKKLFVFILAHDCEDTTIIDYLLNKGYSLIIGLYNCDLVKAKRIQENQYKMDEDFNINCFYFNNEKLKFIVDLIKRKKYISQIMISNNINFKTQLKKYGSFGYTNLFVNYIHKIIKEAELNNEEARKIFNENLINLLSWWQPPKKEEKKVKMITCEK